MSDQVITVPARGIQEITAEIRVITGQARQYLAHTIIELGRRLTEAKALVPAGEWLNYLETEVEYSESTAENYMRIFREYGDQQISLFNPNSESLLNLPYTKLLRLLAVPAEERADFAQKIEAEKLSTRELEEAIREREQAEAERDRALQAKNKAESAMKSIEESQNRDKQVLENMSKKALDAESKVESLKKKLEAAKAEAKKAKKEAEAAKNAKPEIPDDLMAQLRQDAEAEAAKKASEEAKAAVDALSARVEAAEAARNEAEKKLEAAKKEQAMSNADVAAFKLIYTQVQEDFNKLAGYLLKIKVSDEVTAEKLKHAVIALIDKLKADVA